MATLTCTARHSACAKLLRLTGAEFGFQSPVDFQSLSQKGLLCAFDSDFSVIFSNSPEPVQLCMFLVAYLSHSAPLRYQEMEIILLEHIHAGGWDEQSFSRRSFCLCRCGWQRRGLGKGAAWLAFLICKRHQGIYMFIQDRKSVV